LKAGGRGKLGKGREDVQVPSNKIRTPKLWENDRKRGRGQEKAPEEVLPESPAGGPTTTSVRYIIHSQGARSSHFGGWPVLAPVDLAELLLSLEGLRREGSGGSGWGNRISILYVWEKRYNNVKHMYKYYMYHRIHVHYMYTFIYMYIRLRRAHENIHVS